MYERKEETLFRNRVLSFCPAGKRKSRRRRDGPAGKEIVLPVKMIVLQRGEKKVGPRSDGNADSMLFKGMFYALMEGRLAALRRALNSSRSFASASFSAFLFSGESLAMRASSFLAASACFFSSAW